MKLSSPVNEMKGWRVGVDVNCWAFSDVLTTLRSLQENGNDYRRAGGVQVLHDDDDKGGVGAAQETSA